ncbi:MAG: hypothetical protein JWM57_4339, partial [Phycisphaerales bacterium]|nr:hypothetical protein [Phycisphaerales bacterium]
STTTKQSDGTKTLVWGGGTASSHYNVATLFVPLAALADPHRTTITHQTLMATIRDGVVTDYTLSNGSQAY